jgi:hypothetical protein
MTPNFHLTGCQSNFILFAYCPRAVIFVKYRQVSLFALVTKFTVDADVDFSHTPTVMFSLSLVNTCFTLCTDGFFLILAQFPFLIKEMK